MNVADIFSAAPCVAAVGIEPDEAVRTFSGLLAERSPEDET